MSAGDHQPPSSRVTGRPSQVLGKARARIGEARYAVAIDVGRHAIIADEPESLGGKNTGPAPFGLLMAALGACTSITLKMYAERKGWPLASLDVDLRYLRTEPDGGDRIERRLTLQGLDERQRARLAEVAERTPVTLVLKNGVAIDTSLTVEKL